MATGKYINLSYAASSSYCCVQGASIQEGFMSISNGSGDGGGMCSAAGNTAPNILTSVPAGFDTTFSCVLYCVPPGKVAKVCPQFICICNRNMHHFGVYNCRRTCFKKQSVNSRCFYNKLDTQDLICMGGGLVATQYQGVVHGTTGHIKGYGELEGGSNCLSISLPSTVNECTNWQNNKFNSICFCLRQTRHASNNGTKVFCHVMAGSIDYLSSLCCTSSRRHYLAFRDCAGNSRFNWITPLLVGMDCNNVGREYHTHNLTYRGKVQQCCRCCNNPTEGFTINDGTFSINCCPRATSSEGIGATAFVSCSCLASKGVTDYSIIKTTGSVGSCNPSTFVLGPGECIAIYAGMSVETAYISLCCLSNCFCYSWLCLPSQSAQFTLGTYSTFVELKSCVNIDVTYLVIEDDVE